MTETPLSAKLSRIRYELHLEINPDTQAAELVTLGLLAISESLDGLTNALHRLGTADAATPMGAIEALAKEVGEGLDNVANAVREE